ncbi:hypothetical protein GGS26DRAFT_1717 [Hypomontagnella submonticulosa]|nr:hypothetical protein GGS26DRAFT_1717 [Hypomontagnella submonticulosa]
MKFGNRTLVLLSGLLCQAGTVVSKDPPLPPWYPLKPWEFSGFRAQYPRYGPYGPNETSMEFAISNPSLIPAGPAPHASGGGYVVFENSTATCLIHWKNDTMTPHGNTKTTCPGTESGATHAEWNITIQQIIDIPPTNYIDISFSLAYRLHAYGSDFYKLMTGNVRLQTGDNMEGGCDDAGRCSYGLIDGTAPLLVQPTLQECKYACG